MDSFPRNDLPPEAGSMFADAFDEVGANQPATWIQAFLANDTEHQPIPLPGPAERALALATVWSEAKYNFAYWDLLPGEAWWDAQYQAFLPRVLDAGTEQEYWGLLIQFARLLADGHTGVYLPHHLRRAETSPPIRLMAVQGRMIVVEGNAFPPGTEITHVDGEPAAELHTRLSATIESSTRHYAEAAAAARVLKGPAGSAVRVLARRWDGTEYEETLRRTGPLPLPPRIAVTNLGDGRLCVTLGNMGEKEVAEAFHRRFPDFHGVTGLVLDLRRSGGGSTRAAYSILARLLSRPATAETARLRTYVPAVRARGGSQRWVTLSPTKVVPDASRPVFTGPVAVLSGPFTSGAAEDFLLAFKIARRGPIIGEPSKGSTGQSLWLPLPGGGAFRVCCVRETMPDGTLITGRGVEPDIPCSPTLTGIASGRDEILEAALRHFGA